MSLQHAICRSWPRYIDLKSHAAYASDLRLEAALATLRPEDFLPPGPWRIMRLVVCEKTKVLSAVSRVSKKESVMSPIAQIVRVAYWRQGLLPKLNRRQIAV